MNTSPELNYRRPLFFSIAFHSVLLLFFLFRFHFDNASQASSPPAEIVQATLVTKMPANSPVKMSAPQKLPVEQNQPPLLPEEILPEKPQIQEKPPTIEPQIQKEVEKALLLEKMQQSEKMQLLEKAAIKKATIEKQKQLEKEKQQKLQTEIQQQLEKEQQQKKMQVATKKRQKEIEQLLQQDLLESSSVKSSTKTASHATKTKSASSSIDNKELDRYKSLITSAISHQWIVPENLKKGLECRLKVHVAPGGVVMNVTLIKQSGDTALDRSAESAVYKASPLPVPKNAALFNEFREFNLTVRPEGILAE